MKTGKILLILLAGAFCLLSCEKTNQQPEAPKESKLAKELKGEWELVNFKYRIGEEITLEMDAHDIFVNGFNNMVQFNKYQYIDDGFYSFMIDGDKANLDFSWDTDMSDATEFYLTLSPNNELVEHLSVATLRKDWQVGGKKFSWDNTVATYAKSDAWNSTGGLIGTWKLGQVNFYLEGKLVKRYYVDQLKAIGVPIDDLRFDADKVHFGSHEASYSIADGKAVLASKIATQLGGDELEECTYMVDLGYYLEEDSVLAYNVEYTALGITYDEMICFYDK